MTGKSKKKRAPGRPPKKVKERIESIKFDLKKIEELAKLGLTDVQLGDVLGVDERTINRWKQDKQFLSVLKKGKQVADNEVIDALYRRANGFEYIEVKKEGSDIKTIEVISKVTKTTKFYPPDTGACVFWLKNRQGWRDKQDIQHSGTIEERVKSMSPAERDERINELKAKLNKAK